MYVPPKPEAFGPNDGRVDSIDSPRAVADIMHPLGPLSGATLTTKASKKTDQRVPPQSLPLVKYDPKTRYASHGHVDSPLNR